MREDVVFVLFNGFAALDAVGPADVFAAANAAAGQDRYRLRYVSAAANIRASNGMAFATEDAPRASRGKTTLFIPGADEKPLRAAMADHDYTNLLRRLTRRVDRICSVCSGAFLLAHLGLLDGRRAATHWRGMEELAATFPNISLEREALYVRDGAIWTSAGVTAGIDMALALVAEDLGQDIAMAVARELVLFLVRPGGQTQFSAPLDLQAKAQHSDLRALVPWLEARLDAQVSVFDMASRMGMSERSFHRRCVAVFAMTPIALLTSLRLEHARTLLQDAGLPLKTVAAQCGFFDLSAFGKTFKATFGATPSQYRAHFRAS